jgi:hypothetical protein
MPYGKDHEVAFRAAQMFHAATGPHVWLLLGSGPWFRDDTRGCWVVIHSWIADGNVVTRIEDPIASPFREEDVFGERLLMRAEVLNQKGGAEWALERNGELLIELEQTAAFLVPKDSAQ